MNPAEQSQPLPSPEEIERLASSVVKQLPSPFRDSLRDVVFFVEDLADADLLRQLRLSDPMQLSGAYEGIPLSRRSIGESGTLPERITLFRRPIIAEWLSSEFSLEQIVAHIIIHEIGHHFGFSDEDMHALEREEE